MEFIEALGNRTFFNDGVVTNHGMVAHLAIEQQRVEADEGVDLVGKDGGVVHIGGTRAACQGTARLSSKAPHPIELMGYIEICYDPPWLK